MIIELLIFVLLGSCSGWGVFALQKSQLDVQRDEFAFIQAQLPDLVYSHTLTLSEADELAISESVDALVEEFLRGASKFKEENPAATYQEAMATVLEEPLVTTITARPLLLVVEVKNEGGGKATKVRIEIEINRPITDWEIETIEDQSKISGGIGEDHLRIEVNRIAPGDSVILTIKSEIAEAEEQLDRLALTYVPGPPAEADLVTAAPQPMGEEALTLLESFAGFQTIFPVLSYDPAERPEISIKVTSDEGSGVPKPRPTEAPALLVFPGG